MDEGKAVVIGILMAPDVFVRAHEQKIVKGNGTERLAGLLASMPDKQARYCSRQSRWHDRHASWSRD